MMFEPHDPVALDLALPPSPPTSEPPGAAWMLTMADMISLLLTFFVLMFAMSVPRGDGWQAMADSMARSLKMEAPRAAMPSQIQSPGSIINPLGLRLAYVETLLEDKLSADPLLAAGQRSDGEGRLSVAWPADRFFAAGSSALRPEARNAIAGLAEALRFINNQVAVETIAAGTGSAPREQALSRALALADALMGAGLTQPIEASARGAENQAPGSGDRTADGQGILPDGIRLVIMEARGGHSSQRRGP